MEEREGGQSHSYITLNIWEFAGGEYGLRATVAAAVMTPLSFGVCCALVCEQDSVSLLSERRKEKVCDAYIRELR